MFISLKHDEIVARAINSNEGNCVVVGTGGLVRSGEFILYEKDSDAVADDNVDRFFSVGQIVSIEERAHVPDDELEEEMDGYGEDRYVLVRRCNRLDRSESSFLDPKKYARIPETLTEVQLTCHCEWIPIGSVKSIAFLFQVDSIQEGKYVCSGIENAFFVRNRLSFASESDDLVLVTEEEFDPFWCPYEMKVESYSKRIWNGMATTTDLCFRAMHTKAQWDGRNKHVHMAGCNYEFFQYLKATVFNRMVVGPIEKKYQFKRAKKRLNADLSVSNRRLRTKVDMVRVLEESELDVLRSTLGTTFGVAITKAVPTLKAIKQGNVSDTVYLKNHDQVRIVTCRDDDIDVDPMKEREPCPVITSSDVGGNDGDIDHEEIARLKNARRCYYPGLEFEHLQSETGVTDLHFNLVFKKLLGCSPTVRKAQLGGKVCVSKFGEELLELEVGDELVQKGKVYKVRSIDIEKDKVVCCITGGTTSLTLAYEEAKNLMNELVEMDS